MSGQTLSTNPDYQHAFPQIYIRSHVFTYTRRYIGQSGHLYHPFAYTNMESVLQKVAVSFRTDELQSVAKGFAGIKCQFHIDVSINPYRINTLLPETRM